jgi:hypothetical protein
MLSLTRFAVFVIVLAIAVPALPQGCALCYTQAASSGARFVGALRNGILILIVPPMFMSIGITWLAYRKRNHFREEIDSGEFESFDE